jgi:lysophospholipase L1-like esterase
MPDMDFFQSFMRQQQEQLRKKYAIMNEYAKKGEVLLVGSSLMEHFPLNELAQSMGLTTVVYNRGIGGYKTMDLWNAREECIFGLKPRKIFINIGTNDIGDHAYRQEKLLEEYRMLLTEIKTRLPETTVYVMAYYPVNTVDEFGLPKERHTDLFLTRTNEAIEQANKAVEAMAVEMGLRFINVNDGLKDADGNLKQEYSTEGLHMYPNAYWQILKNLRPYIEE